MCSARQRHPVINKVHIQNMIRAKASSLTAQGSFIFSLAVLDRVRPSIRTNRFSLRHRLSFAGSSHRANRIFVLWILAVSVAIVFWANPNALLLANEQASLEVRALNLDQQLICPVCPGETLHQSQVTLAKQMKKIIRDRLADGESEDAILDYFVSVYGESILASPPKRGFWLIAWVIPFIALALGAIIVVLALKSLKRPTSIAQSENQNPDP